MKNLEAFEEGQLCYVVRRPYKGDGEPVLILHEAKLVDLAGIPSFYYGSNRTWIVPSDNVQYSEPSTAIEGDLKPMESTNG